MFHACNGKFVHHENVGEVSLGSGGGVVSLAKFAIDMNGDLVAVQRLGKKAFDFKNVPADSG